MAKQTPRITPQTAHFWEGARNGEFRLQSCRGCNHIYFPPRPFCPKCSSRDVSVFAASGRARLYSYVINYYPRPDWPREHHSIAIVELEEGPRLVSNIVNCPQTPEHLQLDMELTLTFEELNDKISLPVFEPAAERKGNRT